MNKNDLLGRIIICIIEGADFYETARRLEITPDMLNKILEELHISWEELEIEAQNVLEGKSSLVPRKILFKQSKQNYLDNIRKNPQRVYNVQSTDEMPTVKDLIRIAINSFIEKPSPAMLNSIVGVIRETRNWEKEINEFSQNEDGTYGYYIELTEEQHKFLISQRIELQELVKKTINKLVLISKRNEV